MESGQICIIPKPTCFGHFGGENSRFPYFSPLFGAQSCLRSSKKSQVLVAEKNQGTCDSWKHWHVFSSTSLGSKTPCFRRKLQGTSGKNSVCFPEAPTKISSELWLVNRAPTPPPPEMRIYIIAGLRGDQWVFIKPSQKVLKLRFVHTVDGLEIRYITTWDS